MKNLLIDFSLLAHANLFTAKAQLAMGGYQLLKHILIRAVLKNINEFSPDSVYICFDGGTSWRKQLSEAYKAQRQAARDKQSDENGGEINWTEFYRILDELHGDFKKNFPVHSLKIHTIEADDIIAHIVKNSSMYDENVILTRDGDYVQLLKYPNTKIYNPIDRKWMEEPNPDFALRVKICMGDKSDNILAIRPRMGVATAEKFVESGELDKLLETAQRDIEKFGKPRDDMATVYYKNEKLIDMSKIPATITDRIKAEVDASVIGNPSNLLKYFVTSGLRELLEDVSRVRNTLSKLK